MSTKGDRQLEQLRAARHQEVKQRTGLGPPEGEVPRGPRPTPFNPGSPESAAKRRPR